MFDSVDVFKVAGKYLNYLFQREIMTPNINNEEKKI